MQIKSRRIETSKAFRTEGDLELRVGGPQPTIQVQGERDKWRVLRIHICAQSAPFHPGANRNYTFVDENDARKVRAQTFQQFIFTQLGGCRDSLLVLEDFHHHEPGPVESLVAGGKKHLPKLGLPADKRSEEDASINDDTSGIHDRPYSAKRSLFFSHQSALRSSDNCQAAASVSLLRRATLSWRSQFTKSFTCSADMPSF